MAELKADKVQEALGLPSNADKWLYDFYYELFTESSGEAYSDVRNLPSSQKEVLRKYAKQLEKVQDLLWTYQTGIRSLIRYGSF